MGKYQIKIEYSTGDSFSTHNTSDYLEISWDSLELAKLNLQNIKQHYELYQARNNHSFYFKKKQLQLVEDKYKDAEWRVDTGRPFEDADLIKFKADNGNWMQIRCFWCGYFEQVQSAEIVMDESDMKIDFY